MSAAVSLDEPGVAAMARAQASIKGWYRTARVAAGLIRKYRAEGDQRYSGRLCDALGTVRFARQRIATIRTLTPDTVCTECLSTTRIFSKMYPGLTACSGCLDRLTHTGGT